MSNTWNETEKPDVYTILNITYWNTLSSKWQNLIDATTQWQVGGMEFSNANTVKQYYNEEIKNQTGYEETMAVGLMYVTDYGYAASPTNWQTALYRYSNTTNINNNWLYLGSNEWTISRGSSYTHAVFPIYNIGNVDFDYAVYADLANTVRPTFYLKSEITLVGGTGSVSDPFKVNL